MEDLSLQQTMNGIQLFSHIQTVSARFLDCRSVNLIKSSQTPNV